MLKICFAGLGSIGKRHLRDLAKIIKSSERSIDALRSGHGNEIQKDILEQINTIYHDISELPKDYDIIFITNPTYLHYDTIKELDQKAEIQSKVKDSISISDTRCF